MPADRHEAAGWLIAEQNLPVSRACRLVKVSRTTWYRPSLPPDDRDADVIGRLNEVVGRHGRWGFWKCFHWLRQRGCCWNHKRVLRVYRAMKLNLPRRAKRRLPERIRQPLDVPAEPHRMWAMDFMHDTLFCGKRFRTLTIIDEGTRSKTNHPP
jgi:putative transposase